MKHRQLKKQLMQCLKKDTWQQEFQDLLTIPAAQLINPLISLLYHPTPIVKWRSVTLIGALFEKYPSKESVRVIMRRFMWYLNEESGGVGWGIPEVFGEVLARNKWLVQEYGSILMHYIIPGQTFLDMEALQTGSIWGIGRASQGFPQHFHEAKQYLAPYLTTNDSTQRAYALWALGQLGASLPHKMIISLRNDSGTFDLYDQCTLNQMSIEALTKALELGKMGHVQVHA